ncbi:short-chain-enoyl-CoA hydratase-like [Folsomia candida]|uniref:short-chain-enoyl-CoA hydratase-like n=1 Tax=Folsomia candida TaxID=158441 RepID=UPI000B8F5E4A|nr:short-chain-enoyl-CoA hydratase-like [Folsomia candida]
MSLTKLITFSSRLSPRICNSAYQIQQRSYGKNVLVEKVDHNITTIGLNRPEKRNCVNLETARELNEALTEFENENDSPVAVLFGKGASFCAGLDLKEVSQFPKDFDFIASKNYDPKNDDGIGPMGPSRRIFKKPVIAAVQGYAVAGGMEITLACDLRVVEQSATFGIFCRRFGVPLIDGGTLRLPHLIGLSRAMDLILTGRAMKGKEAFEIGLANRLVPDGTALSAAVQLAVEISKFPQECMNRDRMSAYYAMFSAKDWKDAVYNEMDRGLDVIHKESVGGAGRFVTGIGRHGSFKSPE